jgi:hypothetical protein
VTQHPYQLRGPTLKDCSYSNFNFQGHALIKFNRLCIRSEQAINNIFTFTFLQEVVGVTSVSMDTELSSAWKRNSQTCEHSGHILYFTCKLLNSMPHFVSGIEWHRPRYSNIPTEKIEQIQVRWAWMPGN